MTKAPAPASPGHYPYRSTPLVPAWRDRKSQAFVVLALAALATAALLHPPQLATIDAFTLRVVMPSFLAIVLALAPRPGTRLGQAVKDLTLTCTLIAVFAGDWIPVLIASFPLVLAVAVLCSRSRLGERLWTQAP